MAAASALLTRARFAEQVGVTFGGARDLYQSLGYERKLTPVHYRERYERGGIAESICEAYPNATWPVGVSVYEDEDPEVETPFEKEVEEFFKRLDVVSRLWRADVLSGLGRFSVILIGAPGALETELPRMRGQSDVLYLTPLGEDRAAIESYVKDTANPRFGLPEFYKLKLGGENEADSIEKRVHFSRVIHVCDGALESDLIGKPRLRSCWNLLDDVDKIVGGGAEASFRRANSPLHANMDPDAEFTTAEEEAFQDEIDDYRHGLSDVIRTQGIQLAQLSAAVGNFGPNLSGALDLVAGTTRIPQRILVGSERGELSSAQDGDNWNSRGKERRVRFGVPTMRKLIDPLIEHGALPKPKSYEVYWPEPEVSMQTVAQTISTIAAANAAQYTADGTIIVKANEMREMLDLEPLTDEELTGSPPLPPAPEPPVEVVDEETDAEGAEVKANARRSPAYVKTVMSLILASWAAAGSSVSASDVAYYVKQGNRAGVERLVLEASAKASDRLKSPMADRLLDVMEDSGNMEGRSLKKSMRSRRAAAAAMRGAADVFTFTFNRENPRAVDWAKANAARLVTHVDERTKLGIRGLIQVGFNNGIPPRQLARDIKSWIGLRPDQVIALQNYMASGASPRQVERYGAKLLSDRALLIARTETNNASNNGQRELWRQAVEAKALPIDVKRVWIGTDDGREREEHLKKNGEVVGIDEPWSDGIEPGEEPNCRCGQGIATPEDIAKFAEREQMAVDTGESSGLLAEPEPPPADEPEPAEPDFVQPEPVVVEQPAEVEEEKPAPEFDPGSFFDKPVVDEPISTDHEAKQARQDKLFEIAMDNVDLGDADDARMDERMDRLGNALAEAADRQIENEKNWLLMIGHDLGVDQAMMRDWVEQRMLDADWPSVDDPNFAVKMVRQGEDALIELQQQRMEMVAAPDDDLASMDEPPEESKIVSVDDFEKIKDNLDENELNDALLKLEFYHGTPAVGVDLESGTDELNDVAGFSFTQNHEIAAGYAGKEGELQVIQVEGGRYVQVDPDFWRGDSDRAQHAEIYEYAEKRGLDVTDINDLQRAMKGLGYDGWLATQDGRVTELRLFEGGSGYAVVDRLSVDEAERLAGIKRDAIASSKTLAVSLNPVRKLTLTKADGTNYTAFWKPEAVPDRGFQRLLEQSGGTQSDREIFVNRIDRLLGTDLTPETTARVMPDGVPGTIAIGEPGTIPAEVPYYRTEGFDKVGGLDGPVREKMIDLTMLDVIIGNTDRHLGNALIDGANIHAIDNGFTFFAGDRGNWFNIRQEVTEPFWRRGIYDKVNLTDDEVKRWLGKLSDKRLIDLINSNEFLTNAAKQSALGRIEALRAALKRNTPSRSFSGWMSGEG